MKKIKAGKDTILCIFFILFCIVLVMLPTGFEDKMAQNAVRCKGKIISVDNSEIQTIGIIQTGDQNVTLKLMDGPFKGKVLSAGNPLLGQMDKDKIYKAGDTALVVLTLNEQGEIIFVNPQDHYRLGLEIYLLGLFAVLLIAYGGFTGLKALLSFLLTALVLWKILVPLLLKGWDPILISLVIMASLSAGIIFLVAGINRKGFTAFLGAFLGVLTSCAMAIYFTKVFHVHGAVMPFAETLLYSGFGHLDLTKIYIAAVFIACAGAVMDLAMDVAASMHEVVCTDSSITRWQAVKSGINVGRAVVGTMTTTLLLAYSGGFITLMMAFMAQGVPWVNTSNFIYVSAEILKTLIGSFGLVTVAPFTALVGGFVLVKSPETALQRV
ncbi:YibE/F family protein [Desulfobacter latus]|uniref:YibE/F family protein n=1 Tax=Desulfobacter latus TaxID=2292 RepID=A0A850T105_9BACT|nr:YibE/F family protein [Desulfobacter latus]NWH05383.1 YibE/F family protein [Desulfobacter latus]